MHIKRIQFADVESATGVLQDFQAREPKDFVGRFIGCRGINEGLILLLWKEVK